MKTKEVEMKVHKVNKEPANLKVSGELIGVDFSKVQKQAS